MQYATRVRAARPPTNWLPAWSYLCHSLGSIGNLKGLGQRGGSDSAMGRGKEPEVAPTDPAEAKKYRDEAAGHLKSGNYERSCATLDKALELSPDDKQALVARSKCRLLLGDERAALADAEAALAIDQNFVKAVYQKAEALYYSGEFEHSLMFYHRGRRMRPDLEGFRLGIQKAQEAIENSIGASTPQESTKRGDKKKPARKASRPIAGQLMVDKMYLESLLQHPDLHIAERRNSAVARQAEEAVRFLENRQEFWRQHTSSKH